jgi:CubicO group peptidase (beta-lactamase class C family)
MKPSLLPACLLLFLSGAPLPAQSNPTGAKAWTAHGFTQEQRKSVLDALQWGIDNKFVPGGALLIIHRGEPIFREGFGLADIESKKPFTADAPCRIASVTKPHTATLLAMLVDEGKLSWDDPVDKYLPQFAGVAIKDKGKASRPPKIRELLSHTAGFASNDVRNAEGPGFDPKGTLAEAVDAIARAGLVTEPGTVYAYTGTGYMVASRVAEVVSGQEFGALMQERLLKPIGSTTAVFQPQVPEEIKQRIPTGYERRNGNLVPMDVAARSELALAFPNAGGGLVSTVDDVARMLMLHRNHGMVGDKRLVSEEALQAQYRAQPATGPNGYGLGFNIMRKDDKGLGDRVRHIGASGTLALIDFKGDVIVVLLTQVPAKQTQPFTDRVMKAVGAVFAKP